MNTSGTSRHIDQLGRIVIPADLRRALGIREGDHLEFQADRDKLVLRKVEPGCAICGGRDELMTVRERNVCLGCVQEIRREPVCAICGRFDNLVELRDRRVCRDCVNEMTAV